MKTQSYRKGWAFVLTLAMVFTTLFGGFGFLGINGVVGEVYAAEEVEWSNGTILGDTTVTDGAIITIPSGATVTLDGTITISGSAIITGGGIIMKNAGANMISVNNGSTLTLSGVTVDVNNTSTLGVYVDGSGKLDLCGSAEITNAAGNPGVGVWVNSAAGTLLMRDNAKITNCSSGDGGGVYSCGTVIMSDNAEISNCTAWFRGGGGILSDSGTFSMHDNAKITSCAAVGSKNGGGVYMANTVFSMSGGVIENCKAGLVGGGVYLSGSATFNVSGSAKIVNNTISGTTTPSNIHLNTGRYVQIAGSGLTAGASLGITPATYPTGSAKVDVVTGTALHTVSAADAAYFSSDSNAHFITYSSIVASNTLFLVANGWTPPLTPETMPTAGFEASTMTLSNVSSGMKYSVNGGTNYIDITSNGSITISGVTAANGIKVFKAGNGTTTTNSAIQTILLTQAATPATAEFTVNQPGTVGGTGTIAGITAAMEYSTNGGTSWTAGGSTLSNIAGGTTYLVRVKGSGTVLASNNRSLTIHAYELTPETTPTAAFEASTMVLSSISSGMKYSVNGGTSFIDITSNGSFTISGVTAANGIKVFKAGNGTTTTNSAVQTITITKAATPAAPAFIVSQPDAVGATGTIAGITAAMEYSTNSGSSWTAGGSTISGIAGGTTYLVRVKGSGTVLASDNYSISIDAFSGSGGSGGGGGGSTPATPVINTNTGSVTANQLKNAADAAKDGGTVTIKSDKTSEVTLPNSGLASLSGKNNSLTVVTENGTLTFDSKAVGAIGTQAAAADITVIVDNVVKTTLTEEQQTKVGDKTVYDLSVMSGGKLISSFNGGKVKVSIPYELKTGETAENLTVWYMADDGSLTEINCTYDAKNKAVTFMVDHFSKYIIGYDELAGWANPFTDVKSSAWYYDAVAFVNTNGLMKGQTDTSFGPQTSMTRGMFVTILGRMEGIDTTLYASKNTFSDVKSNQYYAPYIAWATDKGIVNGMGGDKFAPNAAVTREQMAVMMTNYLKFKGQGPAGAWAIQLTYGDLDKVSSWADEAVMFMTMKDLMNGMGNDAKGNPMFAPKSTSTRAQTAQVMMSLGELVK